MPRMALLILTALYGVSILGAQAVGADADPSDALGAIANADQAQPDARDTKPVRRGGTSAKTGQPVGAQSSTQTGWRSTAALGAVVALILLLAWGYRTAIGKAALPLARGAKTSAGVLQIVSRTSIAPRHSLCLVRVGQRMVLIGVSADRLTTLDVIVDADSVASLAGRAVADNVESRSNEFRQALSDEKAHAAGVSDLLVEGVDDRSSVRLRDQLADTLQRLRTSSGVRG